MIELVNVNKDFEASNHEINHVLNDRIGIIGPNGSGKSTLLNTIAGSFPVTSGKVLFDGEDVTNLKDYQRASLIGRVFQDPSTGTIGFIFLFPFLFC